MEISDWRFNENQRFELYICTRTSARAPTQHQHIHQKSACIAELCAMPFRNSKRLFYYVIINVGVIVFAAARLMFSFKKFTNPCICICDACAWEWTKVSVVHICPIAWSGALFHHCYSPRCYKNLIELLLCYSFKLDFMQTKFSFPLGVGVPRWSESGKKHLIK